MVARAMLKMLLSQASNIFKDYVEALDRSDRLLANNAGAVSVVAKIDDTIGSIRKGQEIGVVLTTIQQVIANYERTRTAE